MSISGRVHSTLPPAVLAWPAPKSEKYLRLLAEQLRRSGNCRAQQLLHELRVRLAAGLLHDLADEEAEHAFLAAPELRDLVGMARDDLVDDALERALIAHLRQSLRRDQRRRIGVGAEQARQDALGGVAIDRAGLDETC